MSANVKDPVCGKAVDPDHSRHEIVGQQDYCFCSEECCNRFVVNPGRYLSH
jgi:YHS domain-containing protein